MAQANRPSKCNAKQGLAAPSDPAYGQRGAWPTQASYRSVFTISRPGSAPAPRCSGPMRARPGPASVGESGGHIGPRKAQPAAGPGRIPAAVVVWGRGVPEALGEGGHGGREERALPGGGAEGASGGQNTLKSVEKKGGGGPRLYDIRPGDMAVRIRTLTLQRPGPARRDIG
jgi:hypothetical protein